MPRIPIFDLVPQSARPMGSGLGDEHSSQMARLLAGAPPSDRLAVFDFSHIERVGAAYLKCILNPFFVSEELVDDSLAGFSPVLVNLAYPGLVADIEEFAALRKRVLLVAAEEGGRLRFQRVLGSLGRVAAATLADLQRLTEATEQDILALDPERTAGRVEFLNPLEELVWLRLATRHRQGAEWSYRLTVGM